MGIHSSLDPIQKNRLFYNITEMFRYFMQYVRTIQRAAHLCKNLHILHMTSGRFLHRQLVTPNETYCITFRCSSHVNSKYYYQTDFVSNGGMVRYI